MSDVKEDDLDNIIQAADEEHGLHVPVLQQEDGHREERHAIALMLEPSRLPDDWDKKRRSKKEWLPEAYLAPETLNLFYDLVAVAVLTNFSEGDAILNAKQIAGLFSFFILFWFVWASQALYDIRFQANDVVHRGLKFLQIVTFGFIGAACQNWWPSWIRLPDQHELDQEALWRLQAHQSILVITICLGVARFILAAQYLYVFWLAKRANRPRRVLLIEAAAVGVSCAFCVASAWVTPTTALRARIKMALLYCGTAVELFSYIGVNLSHTYTRIPSDRIGTRINALTLIILGEGFIGFLAAGSTRMEAIGARDPWIFVEIFFAVALLALLYHFAMAVFDNTREMGRKRTLVFVLLHFFLHFGLLLLISALENLLTALAFNRSANDLADLLNDYDQLEKQMESGHMPQKNYYALLTTFDLSLNQTFPEFIHWLSASNMDDSNTFVVVLQYFCELIEALAVQTYSLTLGNSTLTAWANAQALDTSSTNQTVKLENVRLAGIYLYRIYNDISTQVFGGVLWLFPSAGGVLFFISLISIVRHPKQTRLGLVIDLTTLVVGVVVALLGCLDIGSKNFSAFEPYDGVAVKAAPIFTLVTSEAAFIIPAGICFALVIFQLILLIAKGKIRRRRAIKQKSLASAIASASESPILEKAS